ncbi:hypothetical protein M9Y10_006777 [Tritrichomonas musculus]|uniref:Protein kinase domain-containing protein n=1 Tax=Tritrichomonas musculus TaxID=1915356 RepID=A0ABR2JF25_9EUKA
MTLDNTVMLDDYVKLDRIGYGSFGEVHQIMYKKTGEIYAAKSALRPLDENSKSEIRDLKRELDILSSLDHKSVLKFVGFYPKNFNKEDKPTIITEYMPNGSLEQILSLKNINLASIGWDDTQKLITIYGIASAMKYLHQNKIIHRDLKPGNILLDEYLIPKIADFGLSKIIHSNDDSKTTESTQKLRGTPIYMAPEIWNELEYTASCDVYAFGLIIYEILLYEQPFKNIQIFEVAYRVTNNIRPEINDELPASYKNLIEKCWSQNPEDRPTFDKIVEVLENDDGFITENIDEKKYQNFIEYIKNDKISASSLFSKVDLKSKLEEIQSENISDDSTKEKSKRSEKNKKTKSSKDPTKRKVKRKSAKDGTKNHKRRKHRKSNQEDSRNSGNNDNKNPIKDDSEDSLNNDEPNDLLRKNSTNANNYNSDDSFKSDSNSSNKDNSKDPLKINEEDDFIRRRSANINNDNSNISLDHIDSEDSLRNNSENSDKDDSDNLIVENPRESTQNKSKNFQKSDTKKSSQKVPYEIERKSNNNIDDAHYVHKLYQMGLKTYHGIKCMADHSLSARYFQKAAHREHAKSQLIYANMLYSGDGVPENKKRSAFYFKLAADGGSVDAMKFYALMLQKGVGIPVDLKQSDFYSKMAAEMENK